MDGDVRAYARSDSARVTSSSWRWAPPVVIAAGDFAALIVALTFGRASVALFGHSVSPLTLEWSQSSSAITFAVSATVLMAHFLFRGQYAHRSSFWEDLRFIWGTGLLYAAFNLALNFLLHSDPSRLPVLGMWIVLMAAIPVGRLISRYTLMRMGAWSKGVLIIGEGEYAAETFRTLKAEWHMGLEPKGFMRHVATDRVEGEISVGNLTVYPFHPRPEQLARQLGCDTVVIALDHVDSGFLTRLTARLMRHQLDVLVVPPVKGLPVHGIEAQHFFNQDMLFLRVRSNLMRPFSRLSKRAFDVVASILLLLATSPLLLYCALRIKLEDRGPVLYAQERVGRKGRPFPFLKFRSMVMDAESQLTQWKFDNSDLYLQYVRNNFKLADDPRVLKVGKWMRFTSIDELPQLWNVLQGHMSLVGPRPLLARELDAYLSEALYMYGEVRPGLTGVWQVSGRSGTTFKDRALMDMWYVRNWSLWVDIVILMKTIRAVVRRSGAY